MFCVPRVMIHDTIIAVIYCQSVPCNHGSMLMPRPVDTALELVEPERTGICVTNDLHLR